MNENENEGFIFARYERYRPENTRPDTININGCFWELQDDRYYKDILEDIYYRRKRNEFH